MSCTLRPFQEASVRADAKGLLVTAATVVAEAAKENKRDENYDPSVFAVYSVRKAATHSVFLLVL